MTDFLARESELLGDEFSTPTATGGSFATAGGDIDFDSAAAAFPDISLDGTGDIPPPIASIPSTNSSSGFSFEDFGTPPSERTTEVKVTGNDEIEKFESDFPEIEVPQILLLSNFYLKADSADVLATRPTVRCYHPNIRTSATTFCAGFVDTYFQPADR
ncbi:unnamed protein product [Somion occarium]|uniref:Clathrin light chain n=1 Tax=Somion occarium TaxID=3059160 RepID=A0ABP1DUQ6_9APHY